MLARTTDENTPLTVPVHGYHITLPKHNGVNENSFQTIPEFFVPSEKICFNPYTVFTSDEPRKLPNEEDAAEPVTLKQVSQGLIEIIKLHVKATAAFSIANKLLPKNDEFQSLFVKSNLEKQYRKNAGDTDTNKHLFWNKVSVEGNNVLKKALVEYIMTGQSPKNVGLEEIYIKIQSLSITEQQSIIESTRFSLTMNNNSFEKMRADELNEKLRNSFTNYKVANGIIAGVFASLATSENFACFSLGFFGGYGSSYLWNQHLTTEVNSKYDEIEARFKEVFDRLAAIPALHARSIKSI